MAPVTAMRLPASCLGDHGTVVYQMVETLAPGAAGARSARRTPDRILDVAMVEFGTRGYEATSLDDLAGRLGIRKQTILYWFPSKEVLLEAVVDRCAAEVTEPARRRRSPRPTRASGGSRRWSA